MFASTPCLKEQAKQDVSCTKDSQFGFIDHHPFCRKQSRGLSLDRPSSGERLCSSCVRGSKGLSSPAEATHCLSLIFELWEQLIEGAVADVEGWRLGRVVVCAKVCAKAVDVTPSAFPLQRWEHVSTRR